MLFGNLGIDKNSKAIGLFLFFFFPLFFFFFFLKDVTLLRVPLRALSRVCQYCSPWKSYGLPMQTVNCFVAVKYCVLPCEQWSQWLEEPLLRLTVTLCP